ncbi:hypothetical protein BB561_002595 [Smittium simulii]|uniref:Bax inhibitor 1 n=1 Tax=Smittium simulii TaxID=133385 RepID=A0A2T9YQ47_9FUNG|nr:hypothetical protein BB561_002595 [Smittium simulii]
MSYKHSYQQIPPDYSESSHINVPEETRQEDVFKLDDFVSQSNVKIRLAFVRKVYSILTIQILSIMASILLFKYNKSLELWLFSNAWSIFLSIFISFISLITINFKARTYPTNMILLSIFTISEAFTVGACAHFYSIEVLMQATIITLGIFIALTAFTIQSKYDFSSMGPILITGLFGLILTGLINFFLPFPSFSKMLICIFTVFLFCGFIIYDTFMIMNRMSPEDYVLASISLYLDFLNIFINILRLLDGNND